MFRRILIANRGEIAARVIGSCRRLGVETVAVYSEADAHGPWLERADRSVCIGPARARDSYLNAGAILQAAEQNECQAIHPGYGFLAENAAFAARCQQQGITFIGPGADAIRRMGDKAEARRAMSAEGLPAIPGTEGVLSGVEDAVRRAEEIGYPVILKATAGGGGRGMRRCDGKRELKRLFGEASLEAEKAFGNPGLYLEKFVEGGRHVEFQVVCDAFGNAIHLGERECSIQRNHQKLVEESPSPVMDSETRSRVGGKVARAAGSLGYRNLGTVEFLRSPDGTLHFMEMNTRLQVEHPVTEMVTGVDLVEEQIRIAAHHPLHRKQEEVKLTGHAIEFRINAEDPDEEFRPDPGTIRLLEPPRASRKGTRVRWDSIAESGYRIPVSYDSMIGKLIVHGPDRTRALEGAREALKSLRIEGIHTTRKLHCRIVEDESFSRGAYDVGFLASVGLVKR